MKIVHICLQSSYTIGWGYQENIMPKYHRRMGHEVTIITTTKTRVSGTPSYTVPSDFFLDDGQRLIRLDYKRFKPTKLSNLIRKYNVYNLLKSIAPDFIMVHGLSNISVLQIRKYIRKENPKCKVIADNHMDYYNGINPTDINKKLWIFSYRILNKIMQKYYWKIYGVTPWRVQYQQEILGIKPDKSGLLIMGGDDDKIHLDDREIIRTDIRKLHRIDDKDFLIISGGKIDKEKNIHLLIEAIKKINKNNIKLVIFGQPTKNFEEEFNRIVIDDHIRYIGWLPADDVYDFFLASDLCVFPGTHSVLWEQACACGIPGIFKSWDGMKHVDVGGNVLFLDIDSSEEIKDKIMFAIENYQEMKENSEKNIKHFSYSEISKRAIYD